MSDGFIKPLLWHKNGGKEWQDGERGKERKWETEGASDPNFPHEQSECDTLLKAIKRGKSKHTLENKF